MKVQKKDGNQSLGGQGYLLKGSNINIGTR